MSKTQNWYIVQNEEGKCQIINCTDQNPLNNQKYWGPFDSEQEAIARRVGLIRAGKCQPF